MKTSSLRWLAVACLAGLVVAGCAKRADQPVRVGINTWPGYEPFFLAKGLGYYDQTGITLVDYPSASEEIRAFQEGALEAATLTMDEVFLLEEKGQHVRVVLIIDTSAGGDVILGKPEFQSLTDLKGKRVGAETSALGGFVLARALDQAGMSPQDIQIVPIEMSEHEQAFTEGRVDAIVTYEPARGNLLRAGAHQLFDSSQIPKEIVDVLIVREEALSKADATLQALIQGWFRALTYLREQPLDAARRIAPRQGVSPEQFLESLKGLHIPGLGENLLLLGKTDQTFLNGLQRLSKFMASRQLLKHEMDPASLLNDRFVLRVESGT